jgi:MFS transporter, FHS family, glucose/mannose:H+ symporter
MSTHQSSRFVFLSACVGLLLFGIAYITLGSVANELQQKFQIDKITFGTLFSILPFGILLGSLIFGPFSDRYGYKPLLVIACLLIFVGFQGVAYASSLDLLKVYIFSFGVGGGILNGGCNAVVSDISSTSKGANLSLLGASFAIGALGMPLILGILEGRFSFQTILSAAGFLSLAVAAIFLMTNFPPAKQTHGIPFKKGVLLLKEDLVLLIGFFLFCQSSLEGIIQNWTTTFLVKELATKESNALFALTAFVVGMAVMRLIIGGVLRNWAGSKIMMISFLLTITGTIMLAVSLNYFFSVSGLVLMGAGLAAGFPVMLGLIGNRYSDLSATAFSLVLTIALLGNMIVNYSVGVVAEKYGIHHLTTFAFGLSAIMITLAVQVFKKVNLKSTSQNYAGKTMVD